MPGQSSLAGVQQANTKLAALQTGFNKLPIEAFVQQSYEAFVVRMSNDLLLCMLHFMGSSQTCASPAILAA